MIVVLLPLLPLLPLVGWHSLSFTHSSLENSWLVKWWVRWWSAYQISTLLKTFFLYVWACLTVTLYARKKPCYHPTNKFYQPNLKAVQNTHPHALGFDPSVKKHNSEWVRVYQWKEYQRRRPWTWSESLVDELFPPATLPSKRKTSITRSWSCLGNERPLEMEIQDWDWLRLQTEQFKTRDQTSRCGHLPAESESVAIVCILFRTAYTPTPTLRRPHTHTQCGSHTHAYVPTSPS